MSNTDASSVLEIRSFLQDATEKFCQFKEAIVESSGIRTSAKSLAKEHIDYVVVRLKKALKNLNDDFDAAEMQLAKRGSA